MGKVMPQLPASSGSPWHSLTVNNSHNTLQPRQQTRRPRNHTGCKRQGPYYFLILLNFIYFFVSGWFSCRYVLHVCPMLMGVRSGCQIAWTLWNLPLCGCCELNWSPLEESLHPKGRGLRLIAIKGAFESCSVFLLSFLLLFNGGWR